MKVSPMGGHGQTVWLCAVLRISHFLKILYIFELFTLYQVANFSIPSLLISNFINKSVINHLALTGKRFPSISDCPK